MFKTIFKERGKCCKVMIDSGGTDNLVSIEMVEKIGLEKMVHPTPYKVSWLHKDHQILVSEQCKVTFQIGGYEDEVLCDGIPMDVCHLLLGRSWKYDDKAIYDGQRNTYAFKMGEVSHTLIPWKTETIEVGNQVLLMNDKEVLRDEIVSVLIDKPID